MDYLVFLIGFIVLCFVVIIVAGFFEARLKKKEQQPPVANQDNKPAETPEFVVGRIYQMEDGSFTKYAGEGKFLKVRK